MTSPEPRSRGKPRRPTGRTVLVSGVTGQQGGAVARSLLHRGFAVRGLSRNPPTHAPEGLANARILRGDLQDARSLARALKGADGFFIVTTPFARGWDQPPDLEAEVRAGVVALEGAKKAGTSHVVLSTVAGVGSATGPTGIGHFDSKARIEDAARRTGVPLTVVRPSYFMENHLNPWALQGIRGGVIGLPVQPATRIQMVAVRDIGEIVARAFLDPGRRIGTAVDLAGDKKTLPEVADLFSRRLGIPVRFVPTPDEEAKARWGEDALNMYHAFDRGTPPIDIPALERTWGIRMTRFEDLLRDATIP